MNINRRTLITAGPIIAVAVVTGIDRKLAALEDNELRSLDQSNRAATALHYVDDAGIADPEIYDKASGPTCRNCMNYQGGNYYRLYWSASTRRNSPITC